MVPSTLTRGTESSPAFRHEALLYDGEAAFDAIALEFVAAGVQAGEAVMVATTREKMARLGAALGADAPSVHFADMVALGANPARIIPAWQEFINDHPGRTLRGLAEPVWAGRTDAELAECRRHEALLNLAFDAAQTLWLLCPYDTGLLAPEVIAGVCRTHPYVRVGASPCPAGAYEGPDAAVTPLSDTLPEPAGDAEEFGFALETLPALRGAVATFAARAGLADERTTDLVLAANEIATNSVLHGGGNGLLRLWREHGDVVCEIRDHGGILEPLAGRRPPTTDQLGGRGLWLTNQVCDLVQVRVAADGGVVRLRMRGA